MTPLSREVKGHPKILVFDPKQIPETHTIHETEDKTPPLAWKNFREAHASR